MPWANFSNWTAENRHAGVTYLPHVKPVRRPIPKPVKGNAIALPGAAEVDYGFQDCGLQWK